MPIRVQSMCKSFSNVVDSFVCHFYVFFFHLVLYSTRLSSLCISLFRNLVSLAWENPNIVSKNFTFFFVFSIQRLHSIRQWYEICEKPVLFFRIASLTLSGTDTQVHGFVHFTTITISLMLNGKTFIQHIVFLALNFSFNWHLLLVSIAQSWWASAVTCNADVYPTTS